jgi:hypothetical protein
MKTKQLRDLVYEELKDIYDAEHRLLTATLSKAARSRFVLAILPQSVYPKFPASFRVVGRADA